MQDGMVVQDFKSTVDFTVRDIFLDNHNWDVFRFQHREVIRQVEVDEVEKMLHCKDGSRGFFIYYCPVCKEARIVYFGCNGRVRYA
ncbi:MAG: transposase zinc-binding domain-containing protein [Candidatus Thermoplasmatota archaeon]|nr:transposase zinc-binding domain-containing protein [Candidatus Thermoplasmatota archaeon]